MIRGLPEGAVEITINDTVASVYVLVDPRDSRIRYVGATKTPGWRLCSHLSSGTRVGKWAREVHAESGVYPSMYVVETVPVAQRAEAERRWIAALLADSHDLLNLKGPGLPVSAWHGLRSPMWRSEPRVPSPLPKGFAQDHKIVVWREAGHTYQEIGTALGISKYRVKKLADEAVPIFAAKRAEIQKTLAMMESSRTIGVAEK